MGDQDWPRGKRGTQRNRKHWMHIWRTPKACPGGDCICDWHEGKTARLASRAVRNQDLPDLEDEYREYLSNVVWSKDGISRLDYAYDAGEDWCGDWCPCGSNLENWMEWLRSQDAYPPRPILNPVLRSHDDN